VTHVDVTDVTRAENDVRRLALELESNDELALSFLHDHAAPVYALVDAGGAVLHRSMSTYKLLGSEPLNGLGVPVLTRVDFSDEALASEVFARVSATPLASEQLVVRIIDRSGRHRTLDLTLTNLLGDPAVKAIVISGNDITEGRFVQIAETIQSRLLKILPAAVVVTDYSGTVVYWNDNATKLFGYRSEEVLGKTSPELKLRPESLGTIDAAVMMSGRWEGDYTAKRTDGTSVPVHTIVELIEVPDIRFQGIVSASIDISDRRALEEALEFQLRHDVLTRLPNRLLLVEHLERELDLRRANATTFAILVVDFDDFRRVNDQFGHAFGDEVLQTWVAQVGALLSPDDLLTRLAGNKFVVCCSSAATVEAALAVAQQICDVTASPVAVGDQSVSFTASIGVAMSGPGSSADRLIRNADVALYAAKEKGIAHVELFDDSYNDEVRARNTLRAELAEALANDEIEAYFQPEVDLATGTIIGFEALARWQHPVHGAISPEVFIPLSEQSGLIGKIGLRILELSCQALKEWSGLRPKWPLSMAVNVSPLQLLDPLFPDSVREVCARFDVNPEAICLEVTESALEDESMAFHALNELKGVGVRIAIDDFGTGYSSLRRLNRYPLDFLKIDQSFVSELNSAGHHSEIIAAVLGIAEALQIETVGEGIETETQRRRLMDLGCRVGQGFLFSEAVPVAEATALIAKGAVFAHHDE
jgi:diguanylate cyclase (GGDEF)-like protein/PAS domain S-box-containing protein